MRAPDALSLAAKVLHDPRLATGAHSGETFTGLWFREPAFVRLYRERPERAVIDLAVMRRLHAVVPLPKLIAAEPRGVSGLPPHLVSAQVDARRADELLDRGLPVPAANALGRQCARLIARLRTVRCEGHGTFVDADLRVRPWPAHRAILQAWFEHLEPGLASAGLGRRSTPGLRPMVLAASQRLGDHVDRPATLVHGDLNGGNLLVDANTGRLRAVLDWEQAHAGDWAEDVGSLLRCADLGSGSSGVGASSWSAFRRGLVDALHAGLHEDGVAGGTAGFDDDWLRRAADLDLYTQLELAARPERGAAAPTPVALARAALRARASQRVRSATPGRGHGRTHAGLQPAR